MAKPTKNILTSRDIQEELLFRSKAEMPVIIGLILLFLILGLPLLIGMLSFLIRDIPQNGFHIGHLLMLLPLLLVFLLFFLTLYIVIHHITAVSHIKSGRFYVLEDRFVRAEEVGEVGPRYARIQKILHFQKHPSYTTQNRDGSVFDYSQMGDLFYLVCYSDKDTARPVLVYNSRVYEYKKE